MNVLVVTMAFLGDTILTLPLIRLAREADRVDRLSVLTTPIGGEFLRGQGGVDEIIVYDKHGDDRGVGGLLRKARGIRRLGFDAALVVHRSFRSALLIWLAGIPRRIGFDESGGRVFLTDVVRYRARSHEIERAAGLLTPLGASPGGGRVPFRVVVPPGAHESLQGELGRAGVPADGAIVVVAPGSQWPTKRWAPERFAEAAGELASDLEATVVVAGAEADRSAGREVARLLGGGAVDLTGALALGPWIALLDRASVLLTNDSAPVHVAAGLGTPVIAVFGPTVPSQGYAPYTHLSRVMGAELECRPCGSHGARSCPLGTLECMESVTAREVVAEARELLAGAEARA
jgi:heptosyltransferase-2